MGSRRRFALLALFAALVAGGCASPGEPAARRPVIPEAVRDLQARQQGDAVVLTFTLPDRSTRGEPLATPPAIEIYRGELAGGQSAAAVETQLVYTIPSELTRSYQAGRGILYRDTVAPGGAAGNERVYAVRTRAARNRASAESNRVTVRVYPAPAAVREVTARVEGQSAVLGWGAEANAVYRVYKAEIAPGSAAAAAANPASAVLLRPLVQVAQMSAGADSSAPLQYQDEDVEFNHSYIYFVRRVARFDSEEVESADSPAAVITVAVSAVPAAPEEVEAVVVPATGTAAAYVSLSWAIRPETEVAGYVVYRSEQQGARGERLNQEPVAVPAYRDESVAAGRRYFYSVAAINDAGQESAASKQAVAEIPAAQP